MLRITRFSPLVWLIPLGVAGISFFAGAQTATETPAPAAKEGKGKGKGGPPRPPLFFREEWKPTPSGAEAAVTPAGVSNANLELKLYGPSGKDIQLTGNSGDEGNPLHLWTGLCEASPCGATLRDKNNFVDLTGLARIKWVTKMSGLHTVRPMVKLADGSFLVGDRATGSVVDWHEDEFSLSDVRWIKLDAEKMVTKGNFIDKPDLSKVDEVGFADLMPGSGHGPGGWADVGRIEVYGKPVKR
ncbi:MAG: hypothetical protein JO307_16750 [Bryobacterales bacterium]|nr:hypothetical protein [Bryobacterales bacterium]MBV9401845.1 hypothetical protein [Bryobacterales bacterium]